MPITFNVQSQALIDDERLRPKSASALAPRWKTETPRTVTVGEETGRTVRTCPAIEDFLAFGYIIPLWTDMQLERVSVDPSGAARQDADGPLVRWRTAHGAFPIEFHGRDQVAGASPLEPPSNLQKVVKPICPWLVETPPGWSILVLPLTLHEPDRRIPLEPLPGAINTDHWHQIHAPCRWRDVEPVMTLRAGTPFMHIIPFKRTETLEPEFKLISEQARLANLAGTLSYFSSSYRRQQKIFDDKHDINYDKI